MNKQTLLAEITLLAREVGWSAQDMGRLKGQWAKKATVPQLLKVKATLEEMAWDLAPTVVEWEAEATRPAPQPSQFSSIEWAADRALAQLRLLCRRTRRGAA